MTGRLKILKPSIKHLRQVIASSGYISDHIDVSPIDLFKKAAVESHLREVKRLLAQVKACDVEKVAKALGPYKKGGVYYVAGNGGSAANASHFAAHLREKAKCLAVSLSDNVPLLTATSNDYSYPEAWKLMYEDMQFLDKVIVFSCSGNSMNILRLLRAARNATTIGFLGNGGGKALKLCKVAIVLDSKNAAAVEDVHSVAMHAVVAAL